MPSTAFFPLAAGAAPPFFVEIAALIAASAAIAYVCYRLGIIPIVGFLIAGVVIGPHALGLVSDQALVDAAAEVGVLLLLFTIGIEFSLDKLSRIQRLIFLGGGSQVVLTTAVVMGVLMAFGVAWQAAVFTGFLVALSSTAIVLKLLGDRGELDEPHGRTALGLLIFQDLAIIVMVLLVPMLAGTGGNALDLVWALAKAALIIVLVLVVARRLMPRFLEAVARTCSPELFLLTVMGICFGTAYLTSLAGVSLALGAFLAGLVVSESRFSEHAMGEIMPLQILFSATFFVSVGMLLDLGFLVSNLPLVIGVVVGVVVIKVLVTGLSVRLLGYTMPVAVASAFGLAQIGEFSFVLERAGREAGLFPAGLEGAGSQTFIAATVLVMILTPTLNGLGERLKGRFRRPAEEAASPEEIEHTTLEDHVIVAGYGTGAHRLVRALSSAEVPFIILTLSPEGANDAEQAGFSVLRGDYARQHLLEHAGIARARTLIIADDAPAIAHRVTRVARSLSDSLHIVVRTRSASEIAQLHAEGVDCVVADELESIVQLFGEVLRDHGTPGEQIDQITGEIRSRDYQALLSTESGSRIAAVTITRETSSCAHAEAVEAIVPDGAVCRACVEAGDTWVHLRVCMDCGQVGCCDSSKNKHARAHFRETGHPVIRSLEAGETWGWCYVDKKLIQ